MRNMSYGAAASYGRGEKAACVGDTENEIQPIDPPLLSVQRPLINIKVKKDMLPP